MPETLLLSAARDWWIVLLRGIAAVLFALMALFWPGLVLVALVLLFGAFALVDGVFAIVAGARARWSSILVFGLVGVVVGLWALFRPGFTALTLVMLVAIWAIVRGGLEIVAAIRLRRELTGEWLLAAAGVASIVFGVLVMLNPGAGAVAIVWIIAFYALVLGVLEIALAFRLRRAAAVLPGTFDVERETRRRTRA